MKFKKGDKVRFKSPDSPNAHCFSSGLKNLTIKEHLIRKGGYNVWESDGIREWFVYDDEIEPNHIDWQEVFE